MKRSKWLKWKVGGGMVLLLAATFQTAKADPDFEQAHKAALQDSDDTSTLDESGEEELAFNEAARDENNAVDTDEDDDKDKAFDEDGDEDEDDEIPVLPQSAQAMKTGQQNNVTQLTPTVKSHHQEQEDAHSQRKAQTSSQQTKHKSTIANKAAASKTTRQTSASQAYTQAPPPDIPVYVAEPTPEPSAPVYADPLPATPPAASNAPAVESAGSIPNTTVETPDTTVVEQEQVTKKESKSKKKKSHSRSKRS